MTSLRWNGAWAFGLLLAAYAAWLAIVEGPWLASGAVWAEGATNYWVAAHAADWSQRLLATDAGYIPLPQRLLALPGAWMPAAWWPWWLSLVATVGAVALVAVLTAARFRALVPGDVLRWLAALVALLVLDFETANFINFIYLAVLPMAAFAALALADPGYRPGWRAWLMPVLFLTKPAVLTVLPPLLLAAWRGGRGVRLVTLACGIAAMVQLARIALSHGAGAMPQHMVFTPSARAVGAMILSLGFLTDFVLPLGAWLPQTVKLLAGAGLALWIARRARRGAAPERALIVCGALVLAGNFVLLAFTLGDAWLGEPRLGGLYLMRQNQPAFLGAELMVLGLTTGFGARGLPAFAGWAAAMVLVAVTAPQPYAGLVPVSQWRALAPRIDAGEAPLCVPVDPAGWVLGIGCRSLSAAYAPGLAVRFVGPAVRQVTVAPPRLDGTRIVSLAILTRPQDAPAQASAVVHLRDGREVTLAPVAPLPARGGLLLFPARLAAADVATLDLRFGAPVQLAHDGAGAVVTGWFGD